MIFAVFPNAAWYWKRSRLASGIESARYSFSAIAMEGVGEEEILEDMFSYDVSLFIWGLNYKIQ